VSSSRTTSTHRRSPSGPAHAASKLPSPTTLADLPQTKRCCVGSLTEDRPQRRCPPTATRLQSDLWDRNNVVRTPFDLRCPHKLSTSCGGAFLNQGFIFLFPYHRSLRRPFYCTLPTSVSAGSRSMPLRIRVNCHCPHTEALHKLNNISLYGRHCVTLLGLPQTIRAFGAFSLSQYSAAQRPRRAIMWTNAGDAREEQDRRAFFVVVSLASCFAVSYNPLLVCAPPHPSPRGSLYPTFHRRDITRMHFTSAEPDT
jgi:hypothetical protein